MANVMICDVCGNVVRERKAVLTLAYERGLKKELDLCDECARQVEAVLRKAAAKDESGREKG